MHVRMWFLGAAAALAVSCGGGRDEGFLAVEPATPAVSVGETVVLTALPPSDWSGEVEWEVQGLYGGGLLQSRGLRVTYVPPAAAGTYTVNLRATGADGRVHKQAVEVRVLGSAAIEPASARVLPGASVQFRAVLKGVPREAVVWAVTEEGGGEIGPDGRYTAPQRPGTYHVTAAAGQDGATAATAVVTVAPR